MPIPNRMRTLFGLLLVGLTAGCGREAATRSQPAGAATTAPPAASAGPAAAASQEPAPQPEVPVENGLRGLVLTPKPWTGDFGGILERRMLRVRVPYSRTLYYSAEGRERGLTAELVRQFEQFLNQKHRAALGRRPLTVYLIPTTRDRLLPALTEGQGDIAAGNITVTEERSRVVDFVAQADQKPVNEIVVTGPKAPPLARLDDLAGKTVHARPTTSYWASLEKLNRRFASEGKKPMTLVELPDALEDEDKLEMVAAGLIDIAVVDDWLAEIWAPTLSGLRVHADLQVASGGRTGWAVRQGSPALVAEIEDFLRKVGKGQGVIDYLRQQQLKRIRAFQGNTGEEDWQRFERTLAMFRKYGERYAFDPLMLAAQGYQESRLDQNAKSHVGAVGIMQIMPATGAELKVGDIHIEENNIHGGAKYLDQLMTRYFPDAHFSEAVRPLFAFASYNAGPGNIAKMRKLAAERGLDPDRWFNNVEIVTAEKIGIETTTYVRNIYKYYVSYKLTLDSVEAAKRVREQAAQSGG